MNRKNTILYTICADKSSETQILESIYLLFLKKKKKLFFGHQRRQGMLLSELTLSWNEYFIINFSEGVGMNEQTLWRY
jgi:hypothetical protein